MKRAQRNVCVYVLGLLFEHLLQVGFDGVAQSLRQGLGHADALAVAPQGISVQVVGVEVVGLLADVVLGTLGRLQKQRLARGFVVFKVGGINAGGFVGHVEPGQAQFQPGLAGFLKFTTVEQRPGLQ